VGRLPSQIHNDQDFFIKTTTDTSQFPLTPWIDQGDWGADDHWWVSDGSLLPPQPDLQLSHFSLPCGIDVPAHPFIEATQIG